MALPEPWEGILQAVVGPYGVVVVLGIVIFFLWRLYRESLAENKANMGTIGTLTSAVKDLTTEVRIWREGVK
jgi:hypothetical protein